MKKSRNQEGEKANDTELCIRVRKMVESRKNLQKEKMKLDNEKMGRF